MLLDLRGADLVLGGFEIDVDEQRRVIKQRRYHRGNHTAP